jgi:DNA-binding protein HU-beta
MNKSDLVAAIAEQTGFTKVKSKSLLEATVSSITAALAEGNKVQLAGFGTWDTRIRKAREGRNPKTGEKIQIPEKTVAKFKPSKKLNEIVNNG